MKKLSWEWGAWCRRIKTVKYRDGVRKYFDRIFYKFKTHYRNVIEKVVEFEKKLVEVKIEYRVIMVKEEKLKKKYIEMDKSQE